MGISLVEYLVKSEQHLKWSTPQFHKILNIPFVPCWDIRNRQFLYKISDLPLEYTKLCAPSDGHIYEEALQVWTQSYILCSEVSKLSPKFKSKIGIPSSVPTQRLILHIQKLQRNCISKVPIEFQNSYCEILTKLCSKLTASIKKKQKKSTIDIKHSLSMCKFVMLDNGDLVYPHQLCFDLDEDLGPFARAVPSYLKNFSKLFSLIGTPMLNQAKAPPVDELLVEKPNISNIFIQARNDPTFSDLIFQFNDLKFYSHKLIVSYSIPMIKTMFSSNMIESQSNIGVFNLPEWINWDGFIMIMDYCYTGNLYHSKKLYPTKENDVYLMTEILRISDLFLMNHLKSFCEVFLSSVQVDVFNVCSLVEIAEMCNANQLLNFCIFTIRIMFATVKHTEEWKQLSDTTKHNILAGSLFAGVEEEEYHL